MAGFLAAGSLVVSAILVAGVHALAWTNATCVSEFWSFNTYQQSPCLVAAYLGTPCSTTGDWSVEALRNDYYGLPARLANPCLCNTVLWNLLSACSMCQTGFAGSWTTWAANCSAVNTNIGIYPLPIPAGTAVPHWAYYDFTNTGVFNAAVVSQQSGPESAAGAAPTSTTSSLISSTTSSVTSNLLQPTTIPQSQSQSTNNTGAIVGGTVGGVLGLVAIGIIVFVAVRRGRRKPEPASHGGYDPSVGTHPGSTAPVTAQYRLQPASGPPGMVSAPSTGSGSAYKPYDPSNPSTFPPGSNISSPSTPYNESLPYSNGLQHQARSGNFTGAPQV